MATVELVGQLLQLLRPVLDERLMRLLVAALTVVFPGGERGIAKAAGMSTKRLWRGRRELRELCASPPAEPARSQRIRRPGGGRRLLVEKDSTLLRDLESLVEPTTRGDPQSPLRWKLKSVRRLAQELRALGHKVSPSKVGQLLATLGYSLQSNRKRIEGKQHPDRDAQFRYIARRTREVQRAGNPVISVDTKKKELVGQFANRGAEWSPSGEPTDVQVHDFFDDRALGKAVPYGVYDITSNRGFVNVGTSHDTGAFAVHSIRSWWLTMGKQTYPEATELLIVADAGGSNGARNRLWKSELQTFADETGLRLHISHMPPGTSKWNKIEHRLFSFISINWRGKPLENYETIVNGSSAESVGVKRCDRVARRSSRSSHRGIVCNVPPASNVPSAGRGGW